MDFEKVLNFGVEYLSDYFAVTVSTMTKPTIQYQPISSNRVGEVLALPKDLFRDKTKLNPKLIGFVIISMFLGSIINSTIPGRRSPPDLILTVVIVIVIWFIFSCLIHIICKLIGGNASLNETLSVSMQILAVLYVVGNLVALIWSAFTSSLQNAQIATLTWYWDIPSIGNIIVTPIPLHHPIAVYFLVQFGLLGVYLPLGLKYLHGFRKWQQVFLFIFGISFIALLYFLIGIPLYQVTHVLFLPTITH